MCFKELERNLELSTNSFQRQLAAEKKKTVSAQEEIRALQEELERMTNKLKVGIQKNISFSIFVQEEHTV